MRGSKRQPVSKSEGGGCEGLLRKTTIVTAFLIVGALIFVGGATAFGGGGETMFGGGGETAGGGGETSDSGGRISGPPLPGCTGNDRTTCN